MIKNKSKKRLACRETTTIPIFYVALGDAVWERPAKGQKSLEKIGGGPERATKAPEDEP